MTVTNAIMQKCHHAKVPVCKSAIMQIDIMKIILLDTDPKGG